jgi:hypothetical protein
MCFHTPDSLGRGLTRPPEERFDRDATAVAADTRHRPTTRDLLGQAPVTTLSAVWHAWTGQNCGWGGSPV